MSSDHYHLAASYPTHHFTTVKSLRTEVRKIYNKFHKGKTSCQWILITELPSNIIEYLSEGDSPFGFHCRLQWNGTEALIKLPNDGGMLADSFRMLVWETLWTMRVGLDDILWIGSPTFRETGGTRGKEADQSFVPPSRQTGSWRTMGWPTLVIETGLPESLSQLREDAKTWFDTSKGDVRIVVILTATCDGLHIEKWQLAPTGESAMQDAYCAQNISITSTETTGAPLMLPFSTLLDRVPSQGESDLYLTSTDLGTMARRYSSACSMRRTHYT